MNEAELSIICIVGMLVFAYVLYQNGFMSTRTMRSLIYASSNIGKNYTARVVSCTGNIKKIIKVKKSKKYNFKLFKDLSKGNVTVYLTDKINDKLLMCLNNENLNQEINLEENKKYGLEIRFNQVTGKVSLKYE